MGWSVLDRCVALAPCALVAAVVVGGTYAPRAHACGGLFCSSTSPTPVDQTAERILFEVLDDGSVSATVEIRYTGNPQDFSWVVPVSGTPDFVDVAGKDELQLLDAATAPSVVPPTMQGCAFGGGGGGGPFAMCAPEPLNDASRSVAFDSGVNVTAYPSVGPFDDIIVVDGGDADVLMAYLSERDYQVNEAMRPFIEQYVLEGYKFLATRLRADATTQDIVPIRFHCPQPTPEIPLRLTAISAEPEMGFLVFIAGSERYRPFNYADVDVDDDDVRVGVDPRTGQTVSTYFSLVSHRIDEAGGRGFVTEGAVSADVVAGNLGGVFLGTPDEEASRAHLEEVLANRRFITRLYGRMNAEEMLEDPQFTPTGDVAEKAPLLDLSSQRASQCSLDAVPPCGASYCGDGDACGESAAGDGCVCSGDRVARVITSPTGTPAITCLSREIDMHASGGDACAGSRCGANGLGVCVPLNDHATCDCDDDAVAVIGAGGAGECVARIGDPHAPDALLWPAPAELDTNDSSTGCAAGVPNVANFGLFVVVTLALRRRRR